MFLKDKANVTAYEVLGTARNPAALRGVLFSSTAFQIKQLLSGGPKIQSPEPKVIKQYGLRVPR